MDDNDVEKKIHRKVDDNITLREVLEMIEEIQKENPDREVFFDGDEQAICSLPRRSK